MQKSLAIGLDGSSIVLIIGLVRRHIGARLVSLGGSIVLAQV